MEAEIADPQLLHEFEAGIDFSFCMLHCAFNRTEGFVGGIAPEHIGSCRAKVVPPSHCKGQMLLHGLSHNDLVRIIEFKSQRICALRTLIRNFGNIFKYHNASSLISLNSVFMAGYIFLNFRYWIS